MRNIGSFLVCLTIFAGLSYAQSGAGELPRRGWFGVALGTDTTGAVTVTAVTPGSTAADAGILAGDIFQSIDDVPMRTPQDVIAAVGRHVGGDRVVMRWLRNGEVQRREVTLRPFPRESLDGVVVEYGSVVTNDGTRLRTIVTVPIGVAGRLPAVMLLQGGGCGSIDMPFSPTVGQPGLMNLIGTKGFVTLRVEKSGVGDSKGPSCASIGYAEELAGYQAALRALRSHPAVDPDRIALLGISLGGVFAPILAREFPIDRVIVYGTLAGPPTGYEGRSDRFFSEFASVDVAGAWAVVRRPVLVLRGEYDEVALASDHARIAGIVNAQSPGSAEHRELERLDHCWSRHATREAATGKCGQGETTSALSDAILGFLKGKL